jgi:predicted SprT family Zn-dependent metalloprotease
MKTEKMEKSRIWLCEDCQRRYQRPRRLRTVGGIVLGECWTCKGNLERVIPRIESNCFKGEPLFRRLMRKQG